jgi:hypothetical protein
MENKVKVAIFTIATIIVTICAVILIANYYYSQNNQQPEVVPTQTTGQKADLEVFDKSGKSLGKYELKFTSGDTLTDGLQKLAATNSTFTYQATSGQYGNFLNTVDGVTADSTREFWNIKVNGNDSDLGMDSLKLNEGEQLQLMLVNF